MSSRSRSPSPSASSGDDNDLFRLATSSSVTRPVKQAKQKKSSHDQHTATVTPSSTAPAPNSNQSNAKQSGKSKSSSDPSQTSYDLWKSRTPLASRLPDSFVSSTRVPIKVERARQTREADISSGIASALQDLAIKKKEKQMKRKAKKKSAKASEKSEKSASEEETEDAADEKMKIPSNTNNSESVPNDVFDDELDSESQPYASLEEEIAAYRDSKFIVLTNPWEENQQGEVIIQDSLLFPVREFSELDNQFQLPKRVLTSVISEFTVPTPIQAQSWPILLGSKDLIGVAQTGSGKSLAFLLPAIIHILAKTKRLNGLDSEEKTPSPSNRKSGSPFVLILAPTQELAGQIHKVAEIRCTSLGISSLCLTGGPSIESQESLLKAPVDLVIGTPGRLLKLIHSPAKSFSLSEVSFLILDEADRLLDLNFESAVNELASLCRSGSKRQTALFSATWPPHVQKLAANITRADSTIQVKIGAFSQNYGMNERVMQVLEPIDRRSGKREKRLIELLQQIHPSAQHLCIVFVLYKREAKSVSDLLQRKGLQCQAISGDLTHAQRRTAVDRFRSGSAPILVATDVAARGLDIPAVSHIINFSLGLSVESYVHRIGRTGRAGASGFSHTFIVDYDSPNVPGLLELIRKSKVKVQIPEELKEIEYRALRKAAKHTDEAGLKGDAYFEAKKSGKLKSEGGRKDSDEDENDEKKSQQSNSDEEDDETIADEDGGKIWNPQGKKHVTQAGNRNTKGGRRGGRRH
jgi:ATP-dependent RNA helicase DBP3